ncbi:MAG: hypothetical protein A3H64_03900 [Candidatus Ryanbacteria bacterium RIFCSPLOWO2_02_FULL_45_11c]|uniref:HEPN domain-containing protein n=1 Tax=Candidatus Ryanbacteria bacterium RIFCSPLOWO2_02_FULL_45_11c TaxID=1802128 RepID=A0A1G2GUV5_9BACT|nr:MAG: hypothetical protein A3H64_03900 [Candidatus Ryanbacteria bacterium RIFCSPLOWO2_02_FULL_45_11c]
MITDFVKNWFFRGEEDIVLIRLILKEGNSLPNLACFHAQQAAEKYLKGFLAYHDLHARKVHSIKELLEDCEQVDNSFSQLQKDADFLSQFYTETRYADDYIEFSREDAEKAFEVATRIKDFVLDKIKN